MISEDVMRPWSAAGSEAPRRLRRVREGDGWVGIRLSKGGVALRLPPHSKALFAIRHHVCIR